MANYTFARAYAVNTATTPAAKEQNSIDFDITQPLSSVLISDNTGNNNFSGNDVSAIGLSINGVNYYGWISRPIKVGGQVMGFYFWSDSDWDFGALPAGITAGTAAEQAYRLGLAQADGNTDGDGNVSDNLAFVLVVNTAYFDSLTPYSGNLVNIGSSSDRVDSALNSLLLSTNHAPVGVADTVTAIEAGGVANATAGTNPTGNALSNDTDADTGDTKTLTAVGTSSASGSVASGSTSASNATSVSGAYGTLAIGADGSYKYTVNNANTSVEALRTVSDTLIDTFTYKLKDAAGATSTTTLTVTIQGANDAPVAVADYNTAKVSTAASNNYTASDTTGALATGNVLTNDTDKDSGDTKAITGSASVVTTGSSSGGWVITLGATISTSGSYLYQWDAATSKATTALLDTSGNKLTATVSGTTVTLSGTPNAAALAYLNGSNDFVFANSQGNGNNSDSYTANDYALGHAASTTVTVASVAGITVGSTVTGTGVGAGVTVTAVNSATKTLTLSATVTSANATLTFAGATIASGSFATFYGDHGQLKLNSDGTYTYTPTINDSTLTQGTSATETFTYTMQDASGATSSSVLTIVVKGSGTTDPNAVDDTGTATEAGGASSGTAATGNVLTNDTAGGGAGPLTVTGAHGVSASGDTAVGTPITGQYGTLTISSTGVYTYTVDDSNPTVQALKSTSTTLTDTFLYTMQNSSTGNPKDTAKLTITIQGANDNPVGTADAATATEKSGVSNATAGYDPSGNVLTNDTDVDTATSALTVTAVSNAGGSGTVNSAFAGSYGSLTIHADGTWTYAVDQTNAKVNSLNTGESVTDAFTYVVSDGSGGSATSTLTITVNGAADPITVSDSFVNEASPYAIFKVTGVQNTAVTLSLSNSVGLASSDVAATPGTDYTNALEYYNGSAWVAYVSSAVIPSGGVLLVRVAITNDAIYEGNESFTLTATTVPTGPGTEVETARGFGTINDEGTGDTYSGTNTTGTSEGTGTNDDRPTISISSSSVTEGDVAQFTVSLNRTSMQPVSFVPTVTSGTATVGTDTDAASALEYSTDGTTWNPVGGAVTIAAGSTTVYLRIATAQDIVYEGSETFSVSTGYIDGAVKNPAGVTGTATIDDAADMPTISVSGSTVAEGGTASFTVSIDHASASAISFTPSVTNGTAIVGTDTADASTLQYFDGGGWQTVTGAVTIGAGSTSVQLRIATTQDSTYEGNETFTLATGAITGAVTNSGGASATATIDDAADKPTISVTNPTVSEGGTASFTVSIDHPSTGAISFTPSVSDGTATVGTDTAAANTLEYFDGTAWQTVSGAVTIGAGSTSVQLRIATTDDGSYEGDEAFTLDTGAISGTVTNPGGATGTATITDNDTVGFTLGAISAHTTEAGGAATFTVRLSSQPTADVVITIASDDATEGTVTAGTTLTFTSANWNVDQTVTVTGVDDHLDDGDIGYHVTLTAASGDTNYSGLNTQVNVTNDDNDGPPVISIGNVTVNEGDGTATFTVTRTGATDDVVSVDYATANGSATAGQDYTAKSNSLTFNAGETSKTVTVAIADDHLVESSETFTVTLSNVNDTLSGAESIGTATGTATITDNDTAGLSIGSVSGNTTESGGTATFTIALTSQPTGTVTITLGSDDAGEGQVTSATTLTFDGSNWDQPQTVTVTGQDDTLDDGDVGYHVTVSAASSDGNYNSLGTTVNVTNADDDGPPLVSIGNVTVNEGDGTATFTVTRSGATGGTTTVNYATSDVSTTAGFDYTAQAGTLTFAAGETSKTISIAITDDAAAESTETFHVTLSNVDDPTSPSESIGTATGTGTIIDNDSATPPGFVIGTVSGDTTEAGGTATFTIKLTTAPTADVVVTLVSDDASEGAITSTTTLTFTTANWNTPQTVTVQGVDDALDDGDIGYHVTLSAASGDTGYQGLTGSVDVTNTDNDAPPLVGISDVSVNEADGTATFTVTRSGADGDTTTVDFATADGTATAGQDYTAASGTLTFAAGEHSKTIVVAIADDPLHESSETFDVVLSNVHDGTSAAAAINPFTGTATIADNDTPGFSFGAVSGNTTEAAGTATFTIALTTQPTGDVVITLASDDTTEGTVTSPTTLTFTSLNWNTPQTVTVTGVDDALDDGDIGYNIDVTAASSDGDYDTMSSSVAVTNADNDGPPVISIGDVTVNEGDGTATFTVTRTGASGDSVTVDYATGSGTAASGSDFTAAGGTLTFGAGEMTKTVVVAIADDHLVESDETFTVTLSNVNDTLSGGESIGTATGTATIQDNDGAGFTLGAVSAHTTEAGGTGTFTIHLNSQPTADVTITFASDDASEGTVTGGTTLTFTSANWDQDQTVTVKGVDDTLDDGDVGYHVTVTAASGDADYNGLSTQVSVTNDDNDGPPVISVGDVTVNEADGTATFTVTRTGAAGDTVTVDYATADGTATAGQDYTAASGTLTFTAGQTSKTVTVNITDDHLVENGEAFTLHLSNVNDTLSGGESIGTALGTATIDDNDTAGFTLGAVSGNTTEAAGTATFTIALSSQPTSTVTITLASDDTSEGTVTSATTITFTSANWNTPQTVTVTGADDHLDDGDIGYHVTIGAASSDTNYNGLSTQVAVTNVDDDGPPVISIGDVTVNEADGTATFTVTRTGASDDAVTVDYATADGTATAGSDYTAASGTLSFAAGQTSKTVTVNITDDHLVESAETFTVTLSNVNDTLSGAESIGTATGTATVTDNDSAGFTIGPISGDTTEAGGTATFTLALSSQPTGTVTVTLGSDDSTEGTVTSATTLTFTAANWNTPQTVTVTGVDDHLDDGDIGYHVTIAAASSDTNYSGLNTQVNVTNDDNDGPPVISIGDVTVSEADGTATFTVTRTGASDDTVTVDYATADGTATAGADYTAASGTLTFAAGETSKTITVAIDDDAIDENNETFTVTLSNVNDTLSGAESIGTATGTGTITDNDTAGFTIGAVSGHTTEAGGTATFTLALSSQPTGTVTITVGTDDGTEGSATATLTFTAANWNTPQTVTVTGVDDHLDDGDIGYHVTLTAASPDPVYDAMSQQVAVTNDDDDAPPVISIGSVTRNEADGTATFTVTRTGASDDVVTVDYATADGTATAGQDYTAASGTLTFAAGETSKTLVVNLTNDAVDENDETFTVHLTNVNDATSAAESIGTADGTGTIQDNDTAGFSISPASGNTTEGGGTATFSIALTSQPTGTVTVTLGSDDSTEGVVTSATTLTFDGTNWNQPQFVTMTGQDDTIDDGDIGYHLTVSAASSDPGYDTMSTQVSITNSDNDGPPVVSIGNATVNEADGTVTFTVTRSGALGGTTTVDYGTADGTATAGADYTAATGTLTFAAGETSKTITVAVTDDHLVESAETFTVGLSNVNDATSAAESIGTATGTATINDNDAAGFTLGPVSGNTTEAGGTATFTVKLNSQPTSDVVVTVTSGDASEGDVVTTTLTFTAATWDQNQTVTVQGVDDTLDDGDIAYGVNLSASSSDANYNGSTTSALVTNADNDGPPVVSVGNATLNEAGGTATFTVTRTGATGGTTTVEWATADGTAVDGQDYTGGSGTLVFAAGETTKTITIGVADDHLVENSETFSVTLSNVNDATSPAESIGQANGTATIIDNDNAGFTITPVVGNTSEAGGTATFTIALSSQPTADVVVTFTSGDPTEGTVTSSVTFTAATWNTPQTVTITGVDDQLDDGDIGYTIGISAASADTDYDGLASSANVTNTDNDGPPVLSVGDINVNEGDGTATFTVTRTGASGDTVTVDFATANGTATAGLDYTAASGTLTFAAGETSKTITVAIADDHFVESAEAFTVTLSNVNDTLSGAESIGTATATATIADNDSAGFNISAISANTTEAGGLATFTIRLNSEPTGTVTITLGSDDTSEGAVTSATTLTFDSSNWDQDQTVTVTGVDDHLDDGDIGYHVTVSAASSDGNYDGRSAQVNVTNADDDGPPVISVGNVTVNESDGTATFTVTRTGASDDTVTVDYATANGSATAGADYDAAGGTLSFAAGETSKTITVAIHDDAIDESNETFTVTLSNVNDTLSGGESIGTNTGTATINDDDTAGISLGAISGNTTESGGTATFTVTLDSQPTADVVLTIVSSDTTEGTVTSTLTFTALNWNQPQTVTVTGVDDHLDDGDIGYSIGITAASGDPNYDGMTATQAVTNADDDGPPVVSIGNVSVNEADGTATFTVTRTGATDGTTTVDWATADGTAAAGFDYTAASGTVTFGAGETSKTVVVAITNDIWVEGSETFTVTLSNVSDATSPAESIGTATGTATIADDDVLTLDVTGSANVSEGANAVFTVTLSNPSATATEIALALGGGSDTAESSDYNSALVAYWFDGATKMPLAVTGGKIVLPAGQTQFFVAVATTQDNVYEGSESFSLNATVTGGDSDTGSSTIVDDGSGTTYDDHGGNAGGGGDDDTPTLQVAGTQGVSEGSHAVFTVTLSNAFEAAARVALHLGAAGDTASSADYSGAFTAYYFDAGNNKVDLGTGGSGVNLPAGVTTFYVAVDTTDDDVYEGREAFTLTATNAVAGSASGTSSIIDDGTGVFYGYKAQATDGGVPDDDRASILVTAHPDVSEGSNAVYTVTLSGASVVATQVQLTLGAGSDTAESNDYASTYDVYYFDAGGAMHALAVANGAISLPAGVTQFYVSVATVQDGVYERSETLTLGAAIVGGDADSGTAAIVDDGSGTVYDPKGAPTAGTPDDDRPTITVTGLPDVSEGSNSVYTVQLSNPSDAPTTISIDIGSGGDTTSSNDYSGTATAYYYDGQGVQHALAITGGTVELPAGVTTFYVSVPTVQDGRYEGGETLSLGASIAGGASDSGTATVVDDGSGAVHDPQGASTPATADDDRPSLTVTALPDVSEGSNAIYTVDLSNPSDLVTHIDIGVGETGDTTSAGDVGTDVVAYYFDEAGNRVTLPITGGAIDLPPGVTQFYVSVPTVQDGNLEGGETLSLQVSAAGHPPASATATVIDDGTGHVYDDHGNATAATPDDDHPKFSADLDPASDNGASNTDHVTSIIDPNFTVNAGALLVEGGTVQLLNPDGSIEGSSVVTANDAATGRIDVQSGQLDDGTYEFTARVLDAGGNIVGEAPVHVTIVTDLDGVQPSIELAANGGDFNHDGIADWNQNNVAQLPVASVADYLAGKNAPSSSFGAIIAGDVHASAPGAPVQLDATAQLLNISITDAPGPAPEDTVQASAVYNFSVTAQAGDTLADMDASRAGVQTRVVIELPQGVHATGYVKWDAASHSWFSYMDDGNLDTYDDGATLVDVNGDGLVDRVVVTLTDGGPGDDDHAANGMIVDPGMLVLAVAPPPPPPPPPPAATPVYDVALASGDHYYTTSAAEAATMAQGTGNVFVGAAFDSLSAADGGHAMLANYNPFTMDWYFAASGGAMPYACYEAMPGAGFGAASAGQGSGSDYHLFLNGWGMTEFATTAQAASLNLAGQGFTDRGAVFNTTSASAFTFDVDGYLVANAANQGVRDLVASLAHTYAHTTDAGFIDAVEQDYLARVQLTGIAHGGAATAADVNAAFGTGFTG